MPFPMVERTHFHRKVLHEDSIWFRGTKQLKDGLLATPPPPWPFARNTIWNQSARVFSLGYFLIVVIFARTYLCYKVTDLFVHLFSVVFHAHFVSFLHFTEHIFYFPSPPNLVSSQHNHSLIRHHPIDSENNHACIQKSAIKDEVFFVVQSNLFRCPPWGQ